jgi:hypothetical protein
MHLSLETDDGGEIGWCGVATALRWLHQRKKTGKSIASPPICQRDLLAKTWMEHINQVMQVIT